jgi:hypothetical protein
MRRTIVLFAALAPLMLGVGSAAANVPGGNGLVSFGTFQCGGGLGEVEVVGPAPPQVPAGFTSGGEKFVMLSLSVVFTDTSGNESTLTKTWGAKPGLDAITCTQHFEEPGEGSGDATAVIALVPPQ